MYPHDNIFNIYYNIAKPNSHLLTKNGVRLPML